MTDEPDWVNIKVPRETRDQLREVKEEFEYDSYADFIEQAVNLRLDEDTNQYVEEVASRKDVSFFEAVDLCVKFALTQDAKLSFEADKLQDLREQRDELQGVIERLDSTVDCFENPTE